MSFRNRSTLVWPSKNQCAPQASAKGPLNQVCHVLNIFRHSLVSNVIRKSPKTCVPQQQKQCTPKPQPTRPKSSRTCAIYLFRTPLFRMPLENHPKLVSPIKKQCTPQASAKHSLNQVRQILNQIRHSLVSNGHLKITLKMWASAKNSARPKPQPTLPEPSLKWSEQCSTLLASTRPQESVRICLGQV